MNTLSYLIDKWDKMRLNTDELAVELGYADSKCVLNAIGAERFPVHTYKTGKYRYADLRDIAKYYDANCAAMSEASK